jgi:hypothetical protein
MMVPQQRDDDTTVGETTMVVGFCGYGGWAVVQRCFHAIVNYILGPMILSPMKVSSCGGKFPGHDSLIERHVG